MFTYSGTLFPVASRTRDTPSDSHVALEASPGPVVRSVGSGSPNRRRHQSRRRDPHSRLTPALPVHFGVMGERDVVDTETILPYVEPRDGSMGVRTPCP